MSKIMDPQISPVISAKSMKMMEILMMEPKIMEKIASGYQYKMITIREDGTVILGKTSYFFWNNLIKCQKVIAFPIFALNVWDALLELSDGQTRLAIENGLSQEIIKRAIRDKKYDEIIDRLIDVSRHACEPNLLKSISTPSIDNYNNIDNKRREVNVFVDGSKRKLTPLDSTGDPIIDIYLEPTSYKVRGGR